MTPQSTALSVLQQIWREPGRVPPLHLALSCPRCLGPHPCPFCDRLWAQATGVPTDHVLPASIALNPSSWYGRLGQYKRVETAPPNVRHDRDYLAAAIHVTIESHRGEIENALGGVIDGLVPTPSTKRAAPVDGQPLARALRRSSVLAPLVRPVLQHREGVPQIRGYCNRELFALAKDAPDLRGTRLVIVDDLWVQGGNVLSAAKTLVDHGAKVFIVVGGRYINTFWKQPEAYIEEARAAFAPHVWPR